MKPSAIIALLAIIMTIGNLYFIAMDKIKPTKSWMLFNNFIILIYQIGSALKFLTP
jgi:hypothetical protein